MFRSAKFMTAAVLLAASAAMAQDATQPKYGDKPAKEKQAEPKKLAVGDRAPELSIDRWVKGDPITGFEKGRVYVVEFWATWCGPCIAGMPHVSDLQKEYKDRGVTVVGVNIWDDPKAVDPFMKDRGDKPSGDDLMKYTVAIEKKDDPDQIRKGVMAKTWMEAAGQNGIPTAFIVDKEGRVAWIGHPMRMDDPLKQVVEGSWDLAKAKEEFQSRGERQREAAKAQQQIGEFRRLLTTGKADEAYPIGRKLMAGPAKDDAMMLNQIAWFIVDPEAPVDNPDLTLALQAAERANELTKGKDGAILDTLARVLFVKGDVKKAYDLQAKAVELAKGTPLEDELQARLTEYKKALK